MRQQTEPPIRIYIHPFEREIQVPRGSLLIDALREAGFHIESICGGKGFCKKCRVILHRGKYDPIATDHQKGFTPQEVNLGYLLACRVRMQENCEITIPVESRIDAPQILLAVQLQNGPIKPAVSIHNVQKIPAPYLPFTSGEVRLEGYTGMRPLMTTEIHRRMTVGGGVLATVSYASGIPEVIKVDDTYEKTTPYGLAIDLGTTTVVCLLVNLQDGRLAGGESAMNEQITYGEEVISRIAFTSKSEGLSTLQQAAISSINKVIDQIISKSGIERDQIVDVCVGGNTVMNYILTGTDPLSLEYADAPVVSRLPIAEADSLGLNVCRKAKIYCLPNVSRFLGGDAIGDVLTSGIHLSKALSLLIDLGTNGEVILGNCDWLASASCASGPAFEGGGILHGMRAMRGAIDHVGIEPETKAPSLNVIGENQPRGICGSGIIDAVCGLFRAGILDFTGRFVDGSSPWVREGSQGLEYLIAPASMTQIGRDIVITQQDLAYIMDSKAAVCGAISVLMKKYRVTLEAMQNVYLAGAFGTYINPAILMEFGVIPAFPNATFHQIGNGSLSGSLAALLSLDQRKVAENIANKMVYIDLLTDMDFTEEYTAALYIPGKKELFPGRV
ncbi:MAG: ASKHA domain-containing protein [Methanomicrobiales archaeon]|nr:ASKHA domain-containing protein [Methanomicrobiales archaeon]